jgi:glycosyltransferase involved in cell wall biosynthesis
MNRPLRVALVSIGIGRFQRGFERYFSDLAELLRTDCALTLYAGAAGPGRHVPPALPLLSRLAHRLPVGRTDTEYRTYKHDCLAYGLAMLPELLQGRHDIVHAIDPPLSKLLERMLPLMPGRPRLLYSNGTAWPARLCPRRAHIHHVQEGSYRAALASGEDPARHSVVPCGIQAARFISHQPRAALRQRHGIADGTCVVLMVGAVKRLHKRVDHVVDEIADLPGDWLLWIDGKPEDADLADAAQARLGSRCRITQVPSADVGQLYALADVMVHAALDESFGLAIVEALSTGLPVLAHDSPHFAWLTDGYARLLDMAAPGVLRTQLAAQVAAHPRPRGAADAARGAAITARYDWPQLKPAYLRLYERLV